MSSSGIDQFIKQRQNLLEIRVDEIRSQLIQINPQRIADNCNILYTINSRGKNRYEFNYWQDTVYIDLPQLIAFHSDTGNKFATVHQAILMYYLITADEKSLSQKWISFSDLPEGKFYNQAFQGYTGTQIGITFKENIADFKNTALELGGTAYQFADASYLFYVLPKVKLLISCWQGDDDFPTSYQILFDSRAEHFLPTDGYAIIGSMLTHKFISIYQGKKHTH